MTNRTWKKTSLTAQPFYKKLCEDERRYKAESECKSPICGWTCLGLTTLLLSPVVWFCVDCFMKAS